MNNTKKYVTLAAVLLCVCAAVYLNWSYNNNTVSSTGMSDAELANAKSAEEMASDSAMGAEVSNYFAAARLTRQQSRDEALNLLKSAASSDTASQETIDGAMNAISAMANYSMMETQIENLLLAKNFAECVAFISADGVTLAVPAPAQGLAVEDVAKITDAIVAETDFAATQITIIEVKSNSGTANGTEATDAANSETGDSSVTSSQTDADSSNSDEASTDASADGTGMLE